MASVSKQQTVSIRTEADVVLARQVVRQWAVDLRFSIVDQTKLVTAASSSKAGKRLRVVATGYSADEPGAASNTRTGHRVQRGVIAVDPKVIPLGTRVYIPGYGWAIASDTGGLIKGNRIDLCFDTAQECERWGRRSVVVILLQ